MMYEPCECCRATMVLGGGLCPECEAQQIEEIREREGRQNIIDACDQFLTRVDRDGSHPEITNQEAWALLHNVVDMLRDYLAEE